MVVLSTITILISIIYLSIILYFSIGWDKIKTYKKGSNSPSDVYISIIVPFRNEEKNISTLFNSLKNQTLNTNLFEILLIDDNSTDSSKQLVLQNIKEKHDVYYIDSKGSQGKKNAIKLGVERSKGNLIVITDADCKHHKEWLETIHSFYNDYQPKMIIGSVIMEAQNSFGRIQCLDFFALMASGAGACGINHPIMCNGANLAFEKELFNSLNDPLNQKFKSGDDVFLLHQIKQKYPGKVLFLKSEKAFVMTKTEKSIINFLRQRIRWASKSKGYTDIDTIIIAIAVFLMNLSLLINFIIAINHISFLQITIIQLFAKSFIDFTLLFKVARFYDKKKLLYYFIPTQILNIFIVPLVATLGFIFNPEWKK